MVTNETSLKNALRPLFIVSKLFGICPFSIKNESVTYTGTILSFVILIAYCTFHIISVSDGLANTSNEANFVTVTINSFNRYSGIVSLVIMILMGIAHQKDITNALRIMHNVDTMFKEEVNIKIDDSTYSRNIKIGLLSIIATTSTLEYFNCLMFIQSYTPYNQYCIIMCLVPYTVNSITEIQFIAYMQLLKNRLKLINDFFSQFRQSEYTKKYPNKNKIMTESQGINNIFLVKEFRGKIKMPTSSGNIQKNINEIKLHGFVGNIMKNRKVDGMKWMDNIQLNNKLFTEKIMKLQQIYSDMEKFLMLIRTGYSVQIITIFTVKFSIITSMLYACCMILIRSVSAQMFAEDDRDQLISSSVWIGVLLFEMFCLCYVSHITKIEAKQIGCNLHHFGREIIYNECKLQVKAFSLELLHDRIEFIPIGLFKLDLQFLYNLFGAVSAYLIILIQFDMAQQISTVKESPQST